MFRTNKEAQQIVAFLSLHHLVDVTQIKTTNNGDIHPYWNDTMQTAHKISAVSNFTSEMKKHGF